MSSYTIGEGSDYMYLTHPSSTGCIHHDQYTTPDEDKENISPGAIHERNKRHKSIKPSSRDRSSNEEKVRRQEEGQRQVMGERLDSAFQAVVMRFSGRDLASELAADYVPK